MPKTTSHGATVGSNHAALVATPGPAVSPGDASWLAHIRLVTDSLRADRTAFSSPMFPMEYVGVQALEAWRRWPDIMQSIRSVASPEDLGEQFRRPGLGINATHFFSLAASSAYGEQRWREMGLHDESDAWRASVVSSFFRGTAGAWRADGFTTSFTGGGAVRPYASVDVDAIAAHADAIDETQRTAFRRSLAALTQYSFLLNIECRIGFGDTGPYPLGADRVLVIREVSDLGQSWRPWSVVAKNVRHDRLVIGMVVGPTASVRITDIATSFVSPGSLIDHVEAVSLFSASPAGDITPIELDDFHLLAAEIKEPSRDLYRQLSNLTYADKLAAGVLIYFSMLRPWARATGLEAEVDWSVPVAALPVMDDLGIDYRHEERALMW